MGFDDILLFMLNKIYSHFETIASSVLKQMFCDLFCAFNTIQPRILANKLIPFKLRSLTIAWVMDSLLSRPQFVRLDDKVSDTILTTGALQGTVLFPFLFTHYTVDYRQRQWSCHLQIFDLYD